MIGQTETSRNTYASGSDLRKLALIFLRLGIVAFGGPAAHIAMMRTEFVERLHWLSEDEFLDLVGASNLIPGPGSTEVAIFIGLRRAGWVGLILAGLFFILPAALIVSAIARAYLRFGHLPEVTGALYGIKPVIIALVGQAVWLLGRKAVRTSLFAVVGVVDLVLCFLGVPPLVLLFGTGLLLAFRGRLTEEKTGRAKPLAALAAVMTLLVCLPLALTAIEPTASGKITLTSILLVFVKIGSAVYGSGYVLLAFLRADLVTRLHWLTSARLLDAVAVGQFTPGPVFTTATFIGYLIAGPWGAFVATVGIFLPAFLLVALSGPLIPRIRSSATAAAFLDGVNLASLALMAYVTWELGRAALIDLPTCALTIISALLLYRTRVNSIWLLLGGVVVGLLLKH